MTSKVVVKKKINKWFKIKTIQISMNIQNRCHRMTKLFKNWKVPENSLLIWVNLNKINNTLNIKKANSYIEKTVFKYFFLYAFLSNIVMFFSSFPIQIDYKFKFLKFNSFLIIL